MVGVGARGLIDQVASQEDEVGRLLEGGVDPRPYRRRADELPMVEVGQQSDTQRPPQAREYGTFSHHLEVIGARYLGSGRSRSGCKGDRGCAGEEVPTVHAVERNSGS